MYVFFWLILETTEEDPNQEGPSDQLKVDTILDCRLLATVTASNEPTVSDYEYFVSRKGRGEEANSWEKYENLSNCRKKLELFHRRHNDDTVLTAPRAKRRRSNHH